MTTPTDGGPAPLPIWEDLPTNVLQMMSWLGGFSPTLSPADGNLKGYMLDDDGGGKVYLGVRDLRDLAHAATVAADWLERRVQRAKGGGE